MRRLAAVILVLAGLFGLFTGLRMQGRGDKNSSHFQVGWPDPLFHWDRTPTSHSFGVQLNRVSLMIVVASAMSLYGGVSLGRLRQPTAGPKSEGLTS